MNEQPEQDKEDGQGRGRPPHRPPRSRRWTPPRVEEANVLAFLPVAMSFDVELKHAFKLSAACAAKQMLHSASWRPLPREQTGCRSCSLLQSLPGIGRHSR